jgi:hypothetical protein
MSFVVRKSNSNLCEEDVKKFVAKHVNEALANFVCSLPTFNIKLWFLLLMICSFIRDFLLYLSAGFTIQENTSSSICHFNSEVCIWKNLKKRFDLSGSVHLQIVTPTV